MDDMIKLDATIPARLNDSTKIIGKRIKLEFFTADENKLGFVFRILPKKYLEAIFLLYPLTLNHKMNGLG